MSSRTNKPSTHIVADDEQFLNIYKQSETIDKLMAQNKELVADLEYKDREISRLKDELKNAYVRIPKSFVFAFFAILIIVGYLLVQQSSEIKTSMVRSTDMIDYQFSKMARSEQNRVALQGTACYACHAEGINAAYLPKNRLTADEFYKYIVGVNRPSNSAMPKFENFDKSQAYLLWLNLGYDKQ